MMLQLVNLSNYITDLELIRNRADELQDFLRRHRLDGVEMMFCEPWDERVHRKEFIQGVHLRFWPSWLDFWRGDLEELQRQFGSVERIQACYGGLTREAWLNLYRDNIRIAREADAKYIVFHVSHARPSELFHWQFSVSDREVIAATVEVVNELAKDIPETMALLFENLWWPGLTLRDRELTALLLEHVRHPNTGIMMDTGHLMNTNHDLKTEEEGVEFILAALTGLGEYRRYIKGVHLHRSLSGEYIKASRTRRNCTMAEVMDHVMKIDEHLPFTTPAAGRIIECVEPAYLVHEFINASMEEWENKVICQQRALAYRGMD
jgi:hypothetical protein